MATTGRAQQRYDHRLRDLVHGTGDVTIATDLGVPRSTARGWLGKVPKVVVSLDVTDVRASELQQEDLPPGHAGIARIHRRRERRGCRRRSAGCAPGISGLAQAR